MSPEFNTTADTMMETAPRDWWRYVGCGVCNSQPREPCRMGGISWPAQARHPHQRRYRAGLMLHAVFWLMDNPDVAPAATADDVALDGAEDD